MTGSGEMTLLGKDVVFEGILTMEGDVRLDGRLRGELHTTGTLTVGEDAIVKGTVKAGILITSGKINGLVIASEKIKILKPAILIGDIRTPAISIEGGARFHGSSDMGANTRVESNRLSDEKVYTIPFRRQTIPEF
jgi:cytoskeletal protein CcmA (bactofilin family)